MQKLFTGALLWGAYAIIHRYSGSNPVPTFIRGLLRKIGKALRQMKKGDILVCSELSRLWRPASPQVPSQTFSSLINKENNKLFNILQTILQLTQKPVIYFTYILFVFFASIFFYNNAVFLAFLTSEISFIRHIKKDGFF